MRQKIFFVWLAVAGIIFAALTLGGCGGSSSNDTVSRTEDNVYMEDNVSMSEIWDDDEAMDEVISRLSSDDIINILFLRIEGIKQQDDDSVNMQYFDNFRYILSGEEYPEVPYNKDELLTHYESGDVILICDAALGLINKVRSDLGLTGEDAGLIGSSGSLELYGMACIRTDNISNTFTYVVPRMDDIIANDASDVSDVSGSMKSKSLDINLSADEVIEQNGQDNKPETAPKEYTMRDFQIDRVVRFFKWLGDMSMMSIENETFASAYQVHAAASNDITRISKAQTLTIDPSYTSYSNVPTIGPKFDGQSYDVVNFNRSRTNTVSYKIYSAHSFTSGKDYYIVQNTTETIPQNIADTYIFVNGFIFNYIYGHTRSVGTEQHIKHINSTDVKLIGNIPSPIYKGIDLLISGCVGVDDDGFIDKGVNYYISDTWTTSPDYKIVNDCSEDSASAKWYAEVDLPDVSNYYNYFYGNYYKKVNAKPSSKQRLQYNAYWVWEIDKEYWKQHETISMDVTFDVKDGSTFGLSVKNPVNPYGYATSDYIYTTTVGASLVLKQPAHTAVSQKTFDFTAGAETEQSFTLLTEDDWTISDIPTWLKFKETNGTATGGTKKQILFDVDENTDTSTREAVLTITSGRDNIKLNITQSGK